MPQEPRGGAGGGEESTCPWGSWRRFKEKR